MSLASISIDCDSVKLNFDVFLSFLSSDTSVYTTTSTSEYTLTSSGSVVVITSLVTAVITGSDPSITGGSNSGGSGGGSGSRSLNGSNGGGNSFFSNTGATAGVFVVVGLVAAGIAIGLGFFFVRRKRARKLDEDTRIAAGGAGDGGAGRNRFEDDDDESMIGDGGGGGDPFGGAGEMSEGHHSSSGYMSSYGSMLPLVAGGAAAYNGSQGGGGGGRPQSGNYDNSTNSRQHHQFDTGYSPAQSSGSIPYQLPSFGSGPTYPAGAGVGYGYGHNARSEEGVLHDNWAEYLNDQGGMGVATGTGGYAGARSAEGAESGSNEGPCKLTLGSFQQCLDCFLHADFLLSDVSQSVLRTLILNRITLHPSEIQENLITVNNTTNLRMNTPLSETLSTEEWLTKVEDLRYRRREPLMTD